MPSWAGYRLMVWQWLARYTLRICKQHGRLTSPRRQSAHCSLFCLCDGYITSAHASWYLDCESELQRVPARDSDRAMQLFDTDLNNWFSTLFLESEGDQMLATSGEQCREQSAPTTKGERHAAIKMRQTRFSMSYFLEMAAQTDFPAHRRGSPILSALCWRS